MKYILYLAILVCTPLWIQQQAYAQVGIAYNSSHVRHSKFAILKHIATKHPDGFTVYTSSLKPVKKGWCVGMIATQNSFGDAGLRRALHIAEQTTKVIGGWKNGNLFYWDAVMLFNSKTAAVKAGIQNRQISIYNIETGRSVNLKNYH